MSLDSQSDRRELGRVDPRDRALIKGKMQWPGDHDSGIDPGLVRLYFELLGPVRRVLDLGCGVGGVGRYKPPSVHVVGLDRDPLAVRLALRFEEASVWDGESGALPFRDAEFDGVIAKDILEHLREPWHIVREIRRVLKPGGTVIVSVPMAKPRVVWNDYTHVRGFTRSALGRMLNDHGFLVEKLFPMGGVPLMGRLRLVRWIPLMLRFPPANWMFSSSWTAVARPLLDSTDQNARIDR